MVFTRTRTPHSHFATLAASQVQLREKRKTQALYQEAKEGTALMIRQWKDQSSRIALDFTSIPMGNDLCVVIAGGDAPHLGAVAVAQARPSLQDSSKASATTSVIALLGHKDDSIARSVAHTLAAKLNKNVVVCCGIHIDRITRDELDSIEVTVNSFCDSYPQEGA
jgi:hypothetical protein